MIYDREEFKRDLARVKRGEFHAIRWAYTNITSAFSKAANALELGRVAESDRLEVAYAATDMGALAVAVRALIDQQLPKKPEDE